jgi:hypothetical protein
MPKPDLGNLRLNRENGRDRAHLPIYRFMRPEIRSPCFRENQILHAYGMHGFYAAFGDVFDPSNSPLLAIVSLSKLTTTIVPKSVHVA